MQIGWWHDVDFCVWKNRPLFWRRVLIHQFSSLLSFPGEETTNLSHFHFWPPEEKIRSTGNVVEPFLTTHRISVYTRFDELLVFQIMAGNLERTDKVGRVDGRTDVRTLCPLSTSLAGQHRNWNVFILMKFLSLAALEVVILITSNAARNENFVKMTTFSFQWMHNNDDNPK